MSYQISHIKFKVKYRTLLKSQYDLYNKVNHVKNDLVFCLKNTTLYISLIIKVNGVMDFFNAYMFISLYTIVVLNFTGIYVKVANNFKFYDRIRITGHSFTNMSNRTIEQFSQFLR